MKVKAILLVSPLLAQVSLWQDSNMYRESLIPGQILEVTVSERFILETDDTWENSRKSEFKLKPDRQNTPFLTPADQNASNKRNTKLKYKFRDKLQFMIPVLVGQPEADGTFPVSARRTIRLDDRTFSVNLTGRIFPASVKNGKIDSGQIAEMNLQIAGEPPLPRDNRPSMKRADQPATPATQKAEFSEDEKAQLLLQHLQQIVGGLNQ